MKRNHVTSELRKLLGDGSFPWAVCGGFALDFFLNTDTRPHGDIDICVFEPDRRAILHHMLDHDWAVYEFRGQGKVRPLDCTMVSDPGRNLMCLLDDCDIVKFYPCEDDGLLYHQFFHTGLRSFHYLEFLFNVTDDDCLLFNREKSLTRKLSDAILFRDGMPYLAPEIALLYKASNAENPDYQFDFEQVHSHLSEEQKAWFMHGMEVLYPNGHPWKA